MSKIYCAIACGQMLGDSICPRTKKGLVSSPNVKCDATKQTRNYVSNMRHVH